MHDSTTPSASIAALAAARWRVAITLVLLMVLVYFGFVALVAFAPQVLALQLTRGLTLGILLGALVIVCAWLLTWCYVRWANVHYDAAIDRIRDGQR